MYNVKACEGLYVNVCAVRGYNLSLSDGEIYTQGCVHARVSYYVQCVCTPDGV